MKKLIAHSLIVLLSVSSVVGLMAPTAALAATLPNLGAAASFSILAQTAITDVPTSVIEGDVGMNNASSNITGLTGAEVGPPGLIYATDPVPVAPGEAVFDPAVQADAAAEFNVGIPGQGTTGTIVGNLDAQTFTPGVYDQGAIVLAGGTVTLDGPGVYIFRSAAALTSAGTVSLINGARACDVFWRVQTAANITTGSFVGTILAGTGVHFGANVTLDGRALAVGADVTLISNTITGPSCAVPTPAPTATPNNGSSGGGGSFLPTPTPTPTPSPTAIALAPTPTPIVGVVFPGAGVGPGGSDIPWGIMLTAVLALASSLLVVSLRKRTME